MQALIVMWLATASADTVSFQTLAGATVVATAEAPAGPQGPAEAASCPVSLRFKRGEPYAVEAPNVPRGSTCTDALHREALVAARTWDVELAWPERERPPKWSQVDTHVVYQRDGNRVRFVGKGCDQCGFSEEGLRSVAVEVRPKAIERVPPRYPDHIKDLVTAGKLPSALDCDARIEIAEDGTVSGLDVQSCPAAVRGATAAAVNQWRFEPVVIGGVVQPFTYELRIKYVLR